MLTVSEILQSPVSQSRTPVRAWPSCGGLGSSPTAPRTSMPRAESGNAGGGAQRGVVAVDGARQPELGWTVDVVAFTVRGGRQLKYRPPPGLSSPLDRTRAAPIDPKATTRPHPSAFLSR